MASKWLPMPSHDMPYLKTYFRQPTSGSDYLRAALVTLYATILTFLGKSYAYFKESTSKRMLKSALGQSTMHIEELVSQIESKQVEVDRTAQLVGMEILQKASTGVRNLNDTAGSMASRMEALSLQLAGFTAQVSSQESFRIRDAIASIMGPAQRLSVNLNQHNDQLTTDSRRQILDWLSPLQYKTQHLTVKQGRMPTSGGWMFQSNEFQGWQNSSVSETLWLHGPPGCGKSKLA